MNYIEINKKSYPFKMTLNALIKYEDKFDKSISDIGGTMSISEIVSLTFFGLEAGAKIEKQELDISLEDLGDGLVDMNELSNFVTVAFNDIAGEGGGEPKKEKSLKK